MRQKASDSTTPRVGIEYPVSLNREPPRFVERILVVFGLPARRFDCLNKERPRVRRAPEQQRTMIANVRIDLLV